ncbi:MAG: hypothetical protein H2069_01625 [Legionella sp.]|nr:hypothetical protein [Legionella sp.]
MRIKEIPHHLFVGSLTVGASLIEGLLSFSGMYALWPVLPVAIGSVALLELYEGEIYLKNIRGALKKISTKHYNENYLARQYMDTIIHKVPAQNLPPFFVEYLDESIKLKEYKNQKNKDNKEKKEIKEKMRAMEQLCAKIIFDLSLSPKDKIPTSFDAATLKKWLLENDVEKVIQKRDKNRSILRLLTGICVVGSALMGVGTIYLLLEAITTIPFFMTLPLAIVPAIVLPMAFISAVAYGLVTYNLMNNFINHETFQHWVEKMKNLFAEGFSVRTALQGMTAIGLVALTLAMTLCTAGTWWTIAKDTRPLSQLLRIPTFVMEIFNPILVGIVSLITSLENATSSLTLLGLFSNHPENQTSFSQNVQASFQRMKQRLHDLWVRENMLQLLNPFRLLLVCTFTPLRIMLFLGHLVSTGVSTARVPRIPESVSIGLSILFEGLGDLSYFFSPPKENKATEDQDLPMKFLTALFLPLAGLSKLWEITAIKLGQLFSKKSRPVHIRSLEASSDSISNTSNPIYFDKTPNASKRSEISEEEKIDHGLYSPRSFSFAKPHGLTMFNAANNSSMKERVEIEDDLDFFARPNA